MSTNVVSALAGQVDRLVDPLVRATDARDPAAALRGLLRAYGWELDPAFDPAPVISAVQDLLELIDGLTDGVEPEDLTAFLEALESIAELITAIEGLFRAIAEGGVSAPTADELGMVAEDLLQGLLVAYVTRTPGLGDAARLVGLVERVVVEETTVGGILHRRAGKLERIQPEALVDLISDPLGHLRARVVPGDWATPEDVLVTHLLLIQHLGPVLRSMGGDWRTHPDALANPDGVATAGRLGHIDVRAPLPDDAGRLRFGIEYELLSAADRDTTGRSGPGVELAPYGGYDATIDLGAWTVTLGALISLGGVDVGDSPPLLSITGAGVEADPGLDARADVGVRVELDQVLGGQNTRVELGGLDAGLFLEVVDDELDVGFRIVADESRIVLSAADLGEAVAAVAAFETALEIDLGIQWSRLGGLRLAGAASLELELSQGLDIGGVVQLSGLRVRLELGESIELSTVTDASVTLGPVAMSFQELGLGIQIGFPPEGGNLGPAHLSVAVQPPKGLGVSVDASVVRGGGFLYLDPERGEYAGVLELSFPALSLSLKAVGIFTTKLPGGAEGYALLLLVYTEFPAIQLGYGFTLNGVGGVLGIQHGVSISALQDGMRTGSLDNLLFPDDPVGNAPELLSDLRSAFPITPRALTFGPMLQLGWGQGVITISLGLVLQFDDVIGPGEGDPSLARIVLLGQLKLVLPPVDDAPELVRLLVDILGYYDFDEQELGIDARLRDSHLASLPLTGSLVVRARFGDDPTFLMAIGGFHPRFEDLPPGLPAQDRLGVQLRYGIITVQITCYTAVTSNSFQFGAEASLVASAASFKVEAYLGFDALFVFDPRFHFSFSFRVGAAISWKKWDLASIRVSGTITGPGRWEVVGSASFSVLFWDVEVDFDVRWGEAPVEALPEAPVLPRIVEELASSDAWSARLPGGRPLVTLRDPGLDGVVAHPLGRLTGRQTVVPFGVELDRVGRTRPSDGSRFAIDGVRVGSASVPVEPVREHFARSEFLDLDEDEKLTTPSFERFDAGVSFGTADHVVGPSEVSFEPEYETAYLEAPDETFLSRLAPELLNRMSHMGAVARADATRVATLVGSEVLGVGVGASPRVMVDAETLEPVGTARSTYTEVTQEARDQASPVLVVEVAEVKT